MGFRVHTGSEGNIDLKSFEIYLTFSGRESRMVGELYLTNQMPQTTKEQILTAITAWYFDDLEFIEKINDLTYSRKVQLKSKLKNYTLPTNNEHQNQ